MRLLVFFVADNVALLTARKGLDPRQGYVAADNVYSPIRTISGGISVSYTHLGYEGFDVEVLRAKSSEATTINLSATLVVGDKEQELPASITVPPTTRKKRTDNKKPVFPHFLNK